MDGEKTREEEHKAHYNWKIATEKVQTPITKLKASPKTHLEGCFVDIVRELFGNNFVITGGFPAYVNGITDRYTDVNFLLPKCLLGDPKYGYLRDSQHKLGCPRSKSLLQYNERLEHRISGLVTRTLETFYKKYAHYDTSDNDDATTSTRVLNYGLPMSVVVESISHDFFPQSMNAHGPLYQVKQRSVMVTRPPDYPTRYLFDEHHSSVEHQGNYITHDSGCYSIAEGHVEKDDIREMLNNDIKQWILTPDDNGGVVVKPESISGLPRDNPVKIEGCQSMCNIFGHADFESYWGATIISVKLSHRDHHAFNADPFRNGNDEPRLMTLVFLENVGDDLKSDRSVYRTDFEECASTCRIYDCKKKYVFERLNWFENTSRQKVLFDKIANAVVTKCIYCIAEACSGSSNDGVTPASPPIGDLLERVDVMHEGDVLSFPRVNKTYSDLFLKHIAYNRLVCNAAKHAMIPHGGVLYMTFLGASKFASNDSTFVSGKEGLYAKRCIAVSGNCLSLREACINRILWHHSTGTLAS